MDVTRSQVLKYTLLPGILPRIYRLFADGFTHIPYFIALIYQAVGILPRGHAYVNPVNVGRYGLRHVIAEAANHLVLDRKHADQIIIFTIIMVGVVLLLMQLMLLLFAVMAHNPVMAMNPADLLSNPSPSNYSLGPKQDLAFIILDQIFGVEGIFNSCISLRIDCTNIVPVGPMQQTGPAFPTPFHTALHAMLHFYSLGIFFIAAMVIIYFVVTITAETAQTGTPFGQRFNKVWAPVRIILCFALLIPINLGGERGGAQGLNAAQIITLHVAKLGSNFASNAWGFFNANLTGTYLGDSAKLIATPNTPHIDPLVKFMFLARTCQAAENATYGHKIGIQGYIVRNRPPIGETGDNFFELNDSSYEGALKFSGNGPITIRFGAQDKELYPSLEGNVKPWCGDIQIPVAKVNTDGKAVSGSPAIQKMYFDLVKEMWKDDIMGSYALCLRDRSIQNGHNPNCTEIPDYAFAKKTVEEYQKKAESGIMIAIDRETQDSPWGLPPGLLEKGWAGAAIWYNRVAEMNGEISAAVLSPPAPLRYPLVMEAIAQQRQANNEGVSAASKYDPMLAGGKMPKFSRNDDLPIAATLNAAHTLWANIDLESTPYTSSNQGTFIDTVNFMFGTSGLFSMRKNADIHPLAQLSALGQSMMYAAVRNFFGGWGAEFVGKSIGQFFGDAVAVAGSFMKTAAMATISLAFVLYYVLPFMPFVYFIFALIGWSKAIFEAIVAMPLWALAHIRIDGEGMPGPAATNGYFLLLEIFLRPVLIVFGLLASIQIFSAIVAVMNDIFDIVEANLTGFDYSRDPAQTLTSMVDTARGPIDKFFFTAIYVIMCYMLSLGCFKLIDGIPNTIMRWFGVSASPLTEPSGAGPNMFIERSYQGALIATQKGNLSGGTLAALVIK